MLYLKRSTIPGAGKGLFTKSQFKRGDEICEYEGEILPWAECQKRADQGYEGYVFFITRNRCIDAYFTPEAIGRYANDARGLTRVEGLKNNAQYEIKTRGGIKRAFIIATRTINPGDEILVDYGADYWQNLEKAKPYYEKLKRERKEARLKKKAEEAAAASRKSKKNGSAVSNKKVKSTTLKRKSALVK